MKQLKLFYIIALGAVSGLGALRGATTVIDDFNAYTNATYIQAQNVSWSRSGSAITDGIYSIAGGVTGRGANFSMAWTAGNAARVKYDFTSAQAYSVGVVFSVDLKTSAAIAGTSVVGVVTDSTGTSWQTSVAQSFADTSYVTYSFSFGSGDTTRTAGSASLVATLLDVKSLTIQFSNTLGLSSQTISFDNLTVTTSAIPEPSSMVFAMGGIGGMAAVLLRRRRGVC